MLKRCYEETYLQKEPTYYGCIVCNQWLNYDIFYNWLISQENYNKWKTGRGWSIDKDIIFKGNKIYSPQTCCLIPQNINSLFTNRKLHRGEYPVGVRYNKKNNNFNSYCMNPYTKKFEYLGAFNTIIDAFNSYKKYKENIIVRVANDEFSQGNITQRCYEAMLNYKIEIND